MPNSDHPVSVGSVMPPAQDSFEPLGTVSPPASTLLRLAAEIAFVGMLAFFVLSPGSINDRHRVLLLLLGLSLPLIAWAVYTMRFSGVGCRLWLLFGAGFALSLAVAKTNLQRPPTMPAAGCAMAVGVLAFLALGAEYLACRPLASEIQDGRRQSFRFYPTHFEVGIVAAVLLFVGIMAAIFPSVGAQNDLDAEVLHNTLGEMVDYGLLLLGLSSVSSRRASFCRTAVILGVACLIRLVWLHTTAA